MTGEEAQGPPDLPDRMSDADALMWDIEADPELRSTITVLVLLDACPDPAVARSRVERATRLFPRLRQRVTAPSTRLGTPRWVEDPQFDLDFHLRHVAAPGTGTLREVLDLAAPVAASGFDRARPLWELSVIERVEGGGAALLLKAHHSMADGVGGIALAGDLFDLEPSPPPATTPTEPLVGDRSSVARAAGALVAAAVAVPRRVGSLGIGATRGLVGVVAHPAGAARDAVGLATSIWRLTAPSPSPESPIMRGRSLSWHFGVDEAPVDVLHAAARRCGGTVNDAFLAIVAGSLARYHERHDVPVERLRMLMPVSIRRRGDPMGGNRFVPARFTVPVGDPDPVRRMEAIGALAGRWRAEPALPLTDTLAAVLDRLPQPVTVRLFGAMQKGVDFIATNVPGVRTPMWFAGAKVTGIYAFGPESGAAASFALLSHEDTCYFGVNIDRAAVPDPDLLMACLAESIAEVCALAGSDA
jgi:WS/DGAT/MGAT family acyltransferase